MMTAVIQTVNSYSDHRYSIIHPLLSNYNPHADNVLVYAIPSALGVSFTLAVGITVSILIMAIVINKRKKGINESHPAYYVYH